MNISTNRFRSPAWDHLIGFSLCVVYVVWLVVTSKTLGFARDEGFYFHAAGDYAEWFKTLLANRQTGLQQSVIDRYWATNHEHPSLLKGLFALSWLALHEKTKWVNDASLAFRFPGMLMGGIGLWTTYLLGTRAYRREVGLIAALLLALIPRVFYHSHLACFDVGIMTLWTLCVYVYFRSVTQGGLGWALATGLVYGLTLETKHNSWILPAVFIAHALFIQKLSFVRGLRRGELTVPLSLLAMAALGPLVFIGLWPWLWHDTLARFQWYASFHLHHDYYNIEFLGRNWFTPPFPRAYAPVMILATVPSVTILLALIGMSRRLRSLVTQWNHSVRQSLSPLSNSNASIGDPAARDILFMLSIGASLSPWLLSSSTPIFGGTKHWLPAYPFLCVFAGLGFSWARAQLVHTLRARPNWQVSLANAAMFVAVLAAPFAVTKHSHPFGLTAYVPVVGGTAGAADLGLNRGFWGFTTQSANAYLSSNAPQGATVFIHDTAWQSWTQMLAEDRVRPDLRGVGSVSESQFALVHHELHMDEVDHGIWVDYATASPAHVVTHDGVPIVSIYRRP